MPLHSSLTTKYEFIKLSALIRAHFQIKIILQIMKTGHLLGTLFTILISSCSHHPKVEPRPAGWQAPRLTAPAQTGQMVDLKFALSGPWAAVFFYPVADTPW